MIPETRRPAPRTAAAGRRADLAFRGVVLLLTAGSLVPIWGFTYFPSQDGPAHLENAWMLRHWFEAGRDFAAYYELVLAPVPNWTSHLLLAVLMVPFPPLLAEKLLLSGYVLLFVAAVLYYLGAVGRRQRLFVLLAFPFIYHLPFLKGFWNFAISVPLLLALLGYWWRRRERPIDWRVAATLNALLVAIYFCHVVSAVIGLACLIGFSWLGARLRPAAIARAAAAVAPAALLPAWFLGSRALRAGSGAFEVRPEHLLRLDVLVSHDPRGAWIAAGLALLFGFLAARTLVREKLRFAGRRLRLHLDLRDGFLLAAAGLAGLACVLPADVAGGGLLTLRLAVFPPLLLLPWLSAAMGPRVRIVVGAAAGALAAAHLAFVLAPFPRLQTAIADYTSGTAHVGRNQTILPVNLLDHRGIDGSRVSALLHAVSYYCLESGAINLDNYEANTGHFPLRYRAERNPQAWIGHAEGGLGLVRPDAYPVPVDFVLIRCPRAVVPGLPETFRRYPPTRRVMQRYRIVHARGDVWLLRRRGSAWPPPVECEP